MNQDLLIHRVEPSVHLAEELQVRLFRQNALVLWKRDFELEMFCERKINGEDGARLGQNRLRESTVVEYGTREYAIFLSNLALEFDDRVRLIREGMGKPAEAAVIALQYH